MDEQGRICVGAATCDETRATRLHYRLRCLLARGHNGAHRWTPELVPADAERGPARD